MTDAQGLALSEDAVFDDFASRVKLAGAVVAEIGGSVPVEFATRHGVAAWHAVDPNREPFRAASGDYQVLRARAEELPLADASVDAVFSSNAFQFIDVQAALTQIQRVLRPGGLLYAHFGPIWSAVDGHQLEYVQHQGRDLVFWRDTLLPPWAHLAYTRDELAGVLASALPPDLVELLLWHVHDSGTVNRMFFEDYVEAALGSGLHWVEVTASAHLDYAIDLPAFTPGSVREVDERELSDRCSQRRGKPTRVGYRDVLMVLRQAD